MRHERERHRGRPEADRQLDLFSQLRQRATGQPPAWTALPAQARTDLTALMTRLILDHVRNASVTGEERREP
jgi:hypothetical protein